MKVQINISKPFGPSVFKVKIPLKIINQINVHIDNIIANNKKQKEFDHGEKLVGDVSQEFRLDEDIMKKTEWANFLKFCINNWIKITLNKEIKKFEILNSWVVRQFKNEYNPTHWHSGHISGAGFLKVPSSFGKHKQNKQTKEYRGGNLQLIHGSKMFLCESTLNIIPKVGDFYFFPNYLMHTVFPFKDSDEERRSISFNAKIDDEIYNVY
tara:strand:+ start:68 stop:700 length:633 start_codon:yes stop_codon:yes gene_type:complete